MKDVDDIDAEYGLERDPCPVCGGMLDGRGHFVLTRVDQKPVKCPVGVLRELSKRLREAIATARTGWSSAHSLAIAYQAPATERAAVAALQKLEHLGDATIPAVLAPPKPKAAQPKK